MQDAPTKLLLLLASLCLAAVPPAAAEEFHLKDGTKIVGKIVGYEENAFRVETSFGLAIIFKDRVVRIEFPEPTPKAVSQESKPAAPATAAKKEAPSPPQPVKAAEPKPPPEPAEIIEHVTATEYVNETYGLRLFKPPTWRSYPQFTNPQGPVVAALGTPDETTLLLIGQERYRGKLNDYVRQAEVSLRRLYQDYRRHDEVSTQVAGKPAVERRFSGSSDGRFWDGRAIYFAHEQQFFTVLAVTAVTENPTLQQAVLRRVLNTLEFLPN